MTRQPDEAAQRKLARGNEALEERVAADLGPKLRHVRRHESLNPLIFPVHELPHVKPRQLLDLSGYRHLHEIAEEKNIKIAAKRKDGMIAIIFDVTKPYNESPDARAMSSSGPRARAHNDRMDKPAAPVGQPLTLKQHAERLAADITRARRHLQRDPLRYDVNAPVKITPQAMLDSPAYRHMHDIAEAHNVKIGAATKFRRGVVAVTINIYRPYRESPDAKAIRGLREQEKLIARRERRAKEPPLPEQAAAGLKAEFTGSAADKRAREERQQQLQAQQELALRQTDLQMQAFVRDQLPAEIGNAAKEYVYIPVEGATLIDLKAFRSYQDVHALCAQRDVKVELQYSPDGAAMLISLNRPYSATPKNCIPPAVTPEQILAEKETALRNFAKSRLPGIIAGAGGQGYFTIPVKDMKMGELRQSQAYQALHAAAAAADKRIELGADGGVPAIAIVLNEPYSASTHAKKFGFLRPAAESAVRAKQPRL